MSKSIAKAQSMPALKQLQTCELKKRVLTAVDRYPGLKNSEEYVAARVGKARDKDRQAEKEYWAHLKKFKEEVKSVFKLPQDSYAGKEVFRRKSMRRWRRVSGPYRKQMKPIRIG